MSVTPPSPGVVTSRNNPNRTSSQREGSRDSDGSRSHSGPNSPNSKQKHLPLSPADKKRKSDLLEASTTREKKESSELEEEGTASEQEEEDLTGGMVLGTLCCLINIYLCFSDSCQIVWISLSVSLY